MSNKILYVSVHFLIIIILITSSLRSYIWVISQGLLHLYQYLKSGSMCFTLKLCELYLRNIIHILGSWASLLKLCLVIRNSNIMLLERCMSVKFQFEAFSCTFAFLLCYNQQGFVIVWGDKMLSESMLHRSHLCVNFIDFNTLIWKLLDQCKLVIRENVQLLEMNLLPLMVKRKRKRRRSRHNFVAGWSWHIGGICYVFFSLFYFQCPRGSFSTWKCSIIGPYPTVFSLASFIIFSSIIGSIIGPYPTFCLFFHMLSLFNKIIIKSTSHFNLIGRRKGRGQKMWGAKEKKNRE